MKVKIVIISFLITTLFLPACKTADTLGISNDEKVSQPAETSQESTGVKLIEKDRLNTEESNESNYEISELDRVLRKIITSK